MLEICIPARNEALFIQDAVLRLSRALNLWPGEWIINVVENGPEDGTMQKILELGNPRIKCIRCSEAGKGSAIKFAARQSKAEIFGFIDADLSADPEMIILFARMVLEGEAEVIIGSRLMETKTTNRSWIRTMSSKLFNFFSKIYLGLEVRDAQCGLKVMGQKSKTFLVQCQETGWFLDIEFLARLRQYGVQIKEVPVPWLEFRYPERKSQINHLKDGIAAIGAMQRIRRRLKYDELQDHD